MMRLSDDSDEELGYESLHLRGGQPYAQVKGGRFDARISTLAWNTIAERIDDGKLHAAGRALPITSK
jgi:hypothetical protein